MLEFVLLFFWLRLVEPILQLVLNIKYQDFRKFEIFKHEVT